MRFTKMHGAGNDYVYVDCFREAVPADVPGLARRISDRHTGVGSDGLILIGPSETADVRMQMWNADGSRAGMCGNGLRCVARYACEHGIASRQRMTIETDAGVVAAEVLLQDGRVEGVRVNLGPPVLDAARIPTTLAGDPPCDVPLHPSPEHAAVPDDLRVTAVSMGNPHCVVFVDEPSDVWVREIGPLVERHPAFPEWTNVEFVQVLAPDLVRVRVWERGSGETLACGSGACAVAVAGALSGRTGRRLRCRLPGGELDIHWDAAGDVLLTGPAVQVFTGDWPD